MLPSPARASLFSLPAFFILLGVASSVPARAQLEHRQAALTVRVETPAGVPLAGASVSVDMIDPAFRFGAAVGGEQIEPGNPNFSAEQVDVLQRYFNSVTLGNDLKWSEYERRGPARTLELAKAVFDLRAFNSTRAMRQRGHTTVWGAHWFVPADARALSGDALRTRILNHIGAYHTTFRDQGLDLFDLYNEPFHEAALITDKLVADKTSLSQMAVEIAGFFKRAREADPNAVLYINDYNMLNFWQEDDADVKRYKQLVDLIRDAGGDVDGIGLQGHMDRYITKAQITRRLDLLAAPMAPTANHPQGLPGLPIEVTELDINTQQWTTATPQQQAEVTANVLDAAFAHPSVQGVTMWGVNDRDHWRNNAILFDDSDPSNWKVKPSGQVWIDRVTKDWWTHAVGTASAEGRYSANVFKGMHRIRVSYQGETKELLRDITQATEVTVQLSGTPVDTSKSRLINLSVRADLAARQTLIIGMSVFPGELPILVRAAGPALGAFNLAGMPDPQLEVKNADRVLIGGNDNWDASLSEVFRSAGAFPFVVGSKDAAIVQTLSAGNTMQVTGSQGGVVLVEAYDVTSSSAVPTGKLINLSARNRVGTGANILIAGFYVAGEGSIRLLIRAVGPQLALAPFGVPNVLANPRLQVFEKDNPVPVMENDDWGDAGEDLSPYFAQAGAFPLQPGSKDAAMVVVLPADRAYTANVSGVNNTTGEALIEVYMLP